MRQLIVLAAFLVTGLAAVADPTPAAALVRYAANNGVDSTTCGAVTSPCRSISRAITNARPGDRIMVGPGHYGDIDGDGQAVTPGDEMANPACECSIAITIPVTVESSAGAVATVIERASPGAAVQYLTYPRNCGVLSVGTRPISAERNFWGSASGPGADPADAICPKLASIDAAPFLTRAVRISNSTGR